MHGCDVIMHHVSSLNLLELASVCKKKAFFVVCHALPKIVYASWYITRDGSVPCVTEQVALRDINQPVKDA